MYDEEIRTCGICQSMIINTRYYYRDHHGWICEKCAPPHRECKYEHLQCPHRDLPHKCWKHESYFCLFSSSCGLCRKKFTQPSMITHFIIDHDISFKTGRKWRVSTEYSPEFLVLSDFGPLVVSYTLVNDVLLMHILAPIASNNLHEYKCVIELSDPVTGRNLSLPVDETYTDISDWKIKADVSQIPCWSGILDITINITKIDDFYV